MKWQPIETAPKDRTKIILAGEHSVQKGIAVYPRKYFRTVDVGYWSAGRWQTGSFAMWEEPTHWMPLPEPPNPT